MARRKRFSIWRWIGIAWIAFVAVALFGMFVSYFGPGPYGPYGPYGPSGRARNSDLELQKLKGVVGQFMLLYDRLPTSLEELVRCPVEAPGCVPVENEQALIDFWGNPYLYSKDDKQMTFQVETLGADGKRGGEGKDRDVAVKGP